METFLKQGLQSALQRIKQREQKYKLQKNKYAYKKN